MKIERLLVLLVSLALLFQLVIASNDRSTLARSVTGGEGGHCPNYTIAAMVCKKCTNGKGTLGFENWGRCYFCFGTPMGRAIQQKCNRDCHDLYNTGVFCTNPIW